MAGDASRRAVLRLGGLAAGAGLGAGLAAGAGLLGAAWPGAARAAGAQLPPGPLLIPAEGHALRRLTEHLSNLPRRRSFTTVPMILNDPSEWDARPLAAVLHNDAGPRQVWNNTDLAGPWLNLMRNALNTEIWGFRHPDFLVVSVTHGPANLALYDQAAWDRYQIAKLTGGRFSRNVLIEETPAGSLDPGDYERPDGVFSSAAVSIPLLMRRGVVFMSCHNAIWEQAAALIAHGLNHDGLSQGALAAELTNHLIPGVVLVPGAVGTLPELEQAGFTYAR